MARFSRTVHIDAPPTKVFALITDPAGIASLDAAIQTVRVEEGEGKPRAVHVTIVPSPKGRPINIEAEVMAYEPDRLMVLQSASSRTGPGFILRYVCAATAGGTDLTCELEIVLGGVLGGLADPLLRRQSRFRNGSAPQVRGDRRCQRRRQARPDRGQQ